MENILDLEYSTLKEKIDQFDERSFRANQIWEGLYKHIILTGMISQICQYP